MSRSINRLTAIQAFVAQVQLFHPRAKNIKISVDWKTVMVNDTDELCPVVNVDITPEHLD